MRTCLLFAAALTLALTTTARAADTVLLADDMEGAIDAKWVAGEPTNPLLEPWQKSDSAAPKVRGNQAHGGATSYWAGPTPQGMHPADVVDGEITLTSKAPIVIPADGKTTVAFWSLFQNEGDDSGTFEAALASNPTAKGAWKKVAAVKLEPSDAADPEYVPGYCVAKPQVAVQGFEEIKGDFRAFAGREVLVRFNLKYGGENRQTSMPCGWYVDDLAITTTGTPGKLATDEPPATPAATTPAPAKSAVRLRAFKAKGKRATLRLTVSGASVKNATITLLKGKKRIATAKASELAVGSRSVRFKLKRKLARGSYVLKLKGTGADGGAVTASGKRKVR